MSLTFKQKQIIFDINSKVNSILAKDGKERDIIFVMAERVSEIKQIIYCTEEKELKMYLDAYKGFYHYVSLLEKVASDECYLDGIS